MDLKKAIIPLLEVRRLIALLTTLLFIILAFRGKLDVNFVQTVIISVISFYFGKSTALDSPDNTNN